LRGRIAKPRPAADPWRRLGAACILQAVKDSQAGDIAADVWLQEAGAEWGADILGIDAGVLRDWRTAEAVRGRNKGVGALDADQRRERSIQRDRARRRAGDGPADF